MILRRVFRKCAAHQPSILLTDTWERFLGADPGLLRLVFAARLALMASLTVLGLIVLNWWGTMPIGGIALGFLVAQFNAGAVRDPTPNAQAVTTLLIAAPAAAGITFAVLLAPRPWASDAAFIALIVLAVVARSHGPRGTAAGMLAFISFYLGQALQARLAYLPYDYAAVAFATSVALLVRLVLIRDRPDRALPRTVRSVRRQTQHLLETVRQFAAAKRWTERWHRRFARRTMRLEEAVITAEDQIDALNGSTADQVTRLGMQLLELELASERIARLYAGHHPPSANRSLRRILGILIRSLDRSGSCPELHSPPSDLHDGLRAASSQLCAAIRAMPRNDAVVLARARDRLPIPAHPAPQTPGPEPATIWRSPLFRQAVQVGMAAIVAMALGHVVSARRWYWSVLAAFIVFAGTSPVATTVTKAIQRVAGTLLGAGAGIAIAPLMIGHNVAIVVLALISDFLAFYAFQTAYGIMMFWITLMLALLYGLLGQFHPALMEIRLAETLLGAAAGAIVALTVLPQHTGEALRSQAIQFLETLCTALTGNPDAGDAAAVRRSAHQLRTVAGPLARGWAAATPSAVRETLRAAVACSYWLRELTLRSDDCSGHLNELHNELVSIVASIKRGARIPEPDAFDRSESCVAGELRRAVWRFVLALDAATGRNRHH